VTQLTEDEQVKIAKRIGLIQHLPSGVYDGTKKVKEYACIYMLLYYFKKFNNIMKLYYSPLSFKNFAADQIFFTQGWSF